MIMTKFIDSRNEIIEKLFRSNELSDYVEFASQELSYYSDLSTTGTGFGQERYIGPVREKNIAITQYFALNSRITEC